MNTILFKTFVIAGVSLVSLTIGEVYLTKKITTVAQTDDLEELKQLDEQKRKKQENLNKKLDVIKNVGKSPEEKSSNWMLSLALVGGGGVVGIGGLLLSRILLIQLLVSKEEQERLLKLPPNQQPWWNRPLFGQNSLFDLLITGNKTVIPDDAINLHNTHLADLKNIGAIAKSQDLAKFNSQDFLFFLKIRSYFVKNIGNYEGLKPSADLLEVAIKSKNSFLKIYQTESRYLGVKQQQFYQNVVNLLGQELAQEEFKQKVEEQLELALPEVKTEEGKQALRSYQEQLEILSEHELGLKLLSLFKAYNLSDFSLLNRVSEIMDNLEKASLTDTKILVIPIMKDYEIFEKLAPIIGLPENKVNPKTFANIIQYLALQDRHRDSYREYANLTKTLKNWKKIYDSIILVREQYNPEEYKIPTEFKEELVAEEIYNKYKSYLD
jgi:hypothetical protein